MCWCAYECVGVECDRLNRGVLCAGECVWGEKRRGVVRVEWSLEWCLWCLSAFGKV